MKGIEAKPSDGRNKYYVEVAGRRYPIKQPIHHVTGLPYIAFTARHAYHILSKLRFDLYHPETEDIDILLDKEAVKQTRSFLVALVPDEDGFLTASCPALPGCHSQGRTKEEALANITEAIQAYTESLRKRGEPLPQAVMEEVKVTV
ncbi:MAG: type II toxin-antitoxin system HicB family antitoxin [Chloroflexi bacterium]|nr:type II toxin-antitoxin system HicB family antitoxin [Chloroflexota bacterium]